VVSRPVVNVLGENSIFAVVIDYHMRQNVLVERFLGDADWGEVLIFSIRRWMSLSNYLLNSVTVTLETSF
jgi:hypothetical protein